MANLAMERALIFGGYEVQHVWGEGSHNGKQGTALFPDAMRFLWKDYPNPIKPGVSKNNTLNDLLIPGEEWQLVADGYRFTEGSAVNAKGEVYYNDVVTHKTYKVGLDGKVSVFLADNKHFDGQNFGPDGRLYSVLVGESKIVAVDTATGKSTDIASGFKGNDIVVANNGNIYATNPGAGTEPSKVWLIKPNGEKQVVDTGLTFTNGVTLSPDQSLLYVADSRSHWVYSYQVQPDGTLAHKQKYYWLHESDQAEDAAPDGMRVDRDGRLYVATKIGIQVCDQAGRVNAIIPTPNGKVANLTFGGENFDTLFAMCGDKVYKRKLKVKGAFGWDKPNKPGNPRL